jgi:uncharacterized protein DUF5615
MWRLLPPGTQDQHKDFGRLRKKSHFLVDESAGHAVATVLREFGWNAVFGPDVGLQGRSDEDVFAYAWRENRILLTHDRDFLDDRRFPPHRNPGVVVLPGASGSGAGLGTALRNITGMLGTHRKAFRSFKIEISSDGVWNITNMTRASDTVRRWRLKFGPRDEVYEWISDPE